MSLFICFFFKQKTAYEMRISDWSSDVCSSDLSGADLKNVLDTLKRTPARMVIYAAYQDPRPVNWMTEHSGLPAAKLPFSPGGLKGADDLFGFYDVTIRQMLNALSGKSS